MINSQFSSPVPGLSLEDQNRFYAEARRQQALAVASFAGAAVKAIAAAIRTTVTSVARAVLQARQLSELSNLSDRQLADMGINRSDIPSLVLGEPAGSSRVKFHGLAMWTPSQASNDWRGSQAA